MKILKDLNVWSEERCIRQQPHDKNGFVANIVSELKEYVDGVDGDIEYEIIDSILDIFVFCATELSKLIDITELELNTNNKYCNYNIDFIFNVVRKLGEIVDSKDTTKNVSHIIGMMENCIYEVNFMGYDFELSINETYKEINSRTGAWDDSLKKWMKFKTPEAEALWYKADYSQTKRRF